MGYTHYWYTEKEINQHAFNAIRADFASLLPEFTRLGIRLAGGSGKGAPAIGAQSICFNGAEKCGHPQNSEIVIPWPARDAAGLGHNQTAVAGDWFAGATLQHRACNGDCSYETFALDRKVDMSGFVQYGSEPENKGKVFNFCKTAFRPYDIAVTACLIIAKHHLGDRIVIKTDGEDPQWQDAKMLCYKVLGYGPECESIGGHLLQRDDRRQAELFTASDAIIAHSLGVRL